MSPDGHREDRVAPEGRPASHNAAASSPARSGPTPARGRPSDARPQMVRIDRWRPVRPCQSRPVKTHRATIRPKNACPMQP